MSKEVQTDEIQSLILTPYVFEQVAELAYILLSVEDAPAARNWIAERVRQDEVRLGKMERDCAGMAKPVEPHKVNLAFTYSGLVALGLDDGNDAERLEFPAAFRMEHEATNLTDRAVQARAARLGDVAHNCYSKWDWGGPRRIRQPDMMLIVGAKDTDDLRELLETWLAMPDGFRPFEPSKRRSFTGCKTLAEVLDITGGTRTPLFTGRFHDDLTEHFGFVDGIAQPKLACLENGPVAPRFHREGGQRARDIVKDGEFILGYPDETRGLSPRPRIRGVDIGTNGSYFVVRQLRQDVFAFRQEVAASAADLTPPVAPRGSDRTAPDPKDWVAARLVGRWPNGAPLAKYPEMPPELPDDLETPAQRMAWIRQHWNGFGFRHIDGHGMNCPIGAHIRRANPRDAIAASPAAADAVVRRSRILRRGRNYGPILPKDATEDDGQERGLFFAAFVTDISRQYEFIMSQWMNDQHFGGLVDETDPFVGVPGGGSSGMTVQRTPVNFRVDPLKRCVFTKGGAYFFMPSRTALAAIARWRAT
ncbi:MAG: hypothetical protein AAGE18_01575 [Pseudomonadota bacterium]